MIDIFENYNVLVRKYLSMTSTSEINDILYINTRLNQCEIFLSVFNDRDNSMEQAEILGLVESQKQLARLFVNKGM